jgi:glycosyltransferase involved in cell wall biosynthesis
MTTLAPLVSVVTPVFDGARFVRRALDSVLAQTCQNWELIAVDDGSSDESPAILAEVAAGDPRVRVLRHPANRGVSAARNTALAAARGELIAYLDQDDEFYPDHLGRAWSLRATADVLLFRYDLVEERPGLPGYGGVARYDPGLCLDRMAVETITVPLGVVHRRGLLDRVGGFDESLGRYRGMDEDGDLWRRFARAGATFAPVPHPSGRYHVRPDSLARTRPAPPEQPTADRAPRPAGGAVPPAPPPPGGAPAGRPRVMFVSYHCYHDPASGAAVCTRDLFAALAARGWRCGVVTGPRLDDPTAAPVGETLRGRPGVRSARGSAGVTGFSVHTVEDGADPFPVSVFEPDPPVAGRPPSAAEAAAFAALAAEVAARFRPDVVMTYGGDAASLGAAGAARRAGARAVFWLHNLAYTGTGPFAGCDAVVVPSEFSRAHYRQALGLDCVALPPVTDPARVAAGPAAGRGYVTLVNPSPEKGVLLFARLAAVLGRDRPDVPLLVVEGRSRADWLGRAGVDLTRVTSLRRMANTPDPRRFYRLTRVLLAPSAGAETFGRVPVEAMWNGIPVVASDRGALPEVVGAGGVCLPLPAALTPAARTPPTEAEARPWVDAVLRLWDDPAAYAAGAGAARAAAARWHPDAVLPRWEDFLSGVAARGRS